MNEDRYERTIDELEVHACKWWPAELREVEQNLSNLPVLLDTQEQFIAILKLANKENPSRIFNLIREAEFPNTLFLKHLIVLTDFGSEPLQRVNKNFAMLFPDGVFKFDIGNGVQEYIFQSLPVSGTLNNAKMRIDTKERMLAGGTDTGMYNDLIMLLIYGAAAVSPMVRGVLYKCTQYLYLGNPAQIEDFVKKNN